MQMRPALVVLAPVLYGIPFKALQFLRRMKRRLLRFACQSLKEPE